MNTEICNLCRDVFAISSEELDALGEMVKQMLDVVIFSKVNFRKIENPLVCKSCKEKLHESFDFKATCIATEDSLYPYLEPDSKEVDLKCVYVKERKVDTTFKFDENDEVCRFCLTLTKSNTAITLKFEVIKHEQFLRNFMPKLMLRDTSDAVICECCHKSLEKYVNFVKSCLDKESKMIQVEETCAYKGNESSTDSLTLASNQLKSDIEIKEEPEFTKNFALEFESLPLKTEQSMDIEEKPPTQLGETMGENSVKDEDCSLPISRMEDFGDSIEMQEINIKPDNGSEGESLDGGFGQKDIYQIVSDEVQTVSVTQKQRSMTKVLCHSELEEISKGNIKVQEHLDKKEEFGTGTFQLQMLEHRDMIKMFKCTICAYETTRKFDLKRHIMLKHKDMSEMEMFKCGIYCNKSEQKHHTLTHRDDVSEIQKFKCEICFYETKHKGYLKTHMLTHKDVSEIKLYKCEICPYVGKRKVYLTSHMQTHQNNSDIKICDCKTKRKSSENAYAKSYNVSDMKMFKCVPRDKSKS